VTGPVRHYSAARGLLALRLFTEQPYGTVGLAEALHIGERAARGLISRLVVDGFLEAVPDTQHPRYRLAEQSYLLGLSLVEAGIHNNVAQRRRSTQPVRVGDSVRAYRRSRGISQEAFADQIGFDHLDLQAIELGKTPMSFEELLDIARRLGVNPLAIIFAPR
jgi:hypothetical protein